MAWGERLGVCGLCDVSRLRPACLRQNFSWDWAYFAFQTMSTAAEVMKDTICNEGYGMVSASAWFRAVCTDFCLWRRHCRSSYVAIQHRCDHAFDPPRKLGCLRCSNCHTVSFWNQPWRKCVPCFWGWSADAVTKSLVRFENGLVIFSGLLIMLLLWIESTCVPFIHAPCAQLGGSRPAELTWMF